MGDIKLDVQFRRQMKTEVGTEFDLCFINVNYGNGTNKDEICIDVNKNVYVVDLINIDQSGEINLELLIGDGGVSEDVLMACINTMMEVVLKMAGSGAAIAHQAKEDLEESE